MTPVDFFKNQFPERPNDKDKSLFLKSDSVTVLGTDEINSYPGFIIASRDQIGVALGQQFGQEAYSQAEKVMKQLLTYNKPQATRLFFLCGTALVFELQKELLLERIKWYEEVESGLKSILKKENNMSILGSAFTDLEDKAVLRFACIAHGKIFQETPRPRTFSKKRNGLFFTSTGKGTIAYNLRLPLGNISNLEYLRKIRISLFGKDWKSSTPQLRNSIYRIVRLLYRQKIFRTKSIQRMSAEERQDYINKMKPTILKTCIDASNIVSLFGLETNKKRVSEIFNKPGKYCGELIEFI